MLAYMNFCCKKSTQSNTGSDKVFFLSKKTYYRIDEPTKEESEATVHENCDILMSQDIVDAKFNTQEV